MIYRPRTGDGVLQNGKALTSTVIKLGTFSDSSHVESLYIPLGAEYSPDQWKCVSAEGTIIKIVDFNRYNDTHIYRVMECDDEAALRAHYRGMELVGKEIKYDWKGLIYVGAVYGARLIGLLSMNLGLLAGHLVLKHLPNPIDDKNKWYCGELFQTQYRPECGNFTRVHPDMTVPEDIARSKKTRRIGTYRRKNLELFDVR